MASERGTAQTGPACRIGVAGPVTRSDKAGSQENGVEQPTIEGASPVSEGNLPPIGILSTTGHANPVGSREVHLPRLNTLDDR